MTRTPARFDWRKPADAASTSFISEHALPNGHTVASNPLLWERQADSFLKSMDTPAAIQP